MRSALLYLLPGLLGALACGSDNSDVFLPFPELCPVYAEQVCAARESCCELSEKASDCELRIADACDVQRKQLGQETGLKYKGEHAQEVRELQQAAVDDCKSPYHLSRFFSDGAKDGASCERPSQCANGACVDGRCAAAKPPALCEL